MPRGARRQCSPTPITRVERGLDSVSRPRPLPFGSRRVGMKTTGREKPGSLLEPLSGRAGSTARPRLGSVLAGAASECVRLRQPGAASQRVSHCFKQITLTAGGGFPALATGDLNEGAAMSAVATS